VGVRLTQEEGNDIMEAKTPSVVYHRPEMKTVGTPEAMPTVYCVYRSCTAKVMSNI